VIPTFIENDPFSGILQSKLQGGALKEQAGVCAMPVPGVFRPVLGLYYFPWRLAQPCSGADAPC
jgi:hypothetical protein